MANGTGVRDDYAALARRVAQLAGTLIASGLKPGERLALIARNTPQYIEALFACWHAGLAAVPINSKLHPSELAYVLEHSGARWAFVDPDWHAVLARGCGAGPLECIIQFGSTEYARLFAAARRDEPVAVASTDTAWLFYTSGTTGRPKGAMLSHGNLKAMSEAFLGAVEPIAAGDSIVHAAPLSHGSGLYVVPHVQRGAANVIPESGGFDADEIGGLLLRWRNVRMFAAPTMVKRLVAHGLPADALPNLVSIVYGGAPMYVEDCKAAYAALGPRLAQIYGQGESPMTITAMPRAMLSAAIEASDEARLGSVGVAQPGIEIRIASASGAALPKGEVGEVLVRGSTVMQGYWKNAEASAAALAGGWLHTGDVGCLDGQGYLTLKDRSKDLIISGGSNIYPREVEEVLQRHPDVTEVAVVGRRHADWGEEVVACVVARRGADVANLERALDRLCLDHIARFKRPKAYVFVDELPKNNTGKVLKTVLRERVA